MPEGELPLQSFPEELKQGLSPWVQSAGTTDNPVSLLDAAAGEEILAKNLLFSPEVKVSSGDKFPAPNTTVDQMDLDQPLPFADQSFDFSVMFLCGSLFTRSGTNNK